MEFISPCKHIPIFKTNTYNKNLRLRGTMLLELFPFVILDNALAFVYAYMQCLDGPVNWFSLTFCILI